jgi:trehalose-6-phosphatase
VFKTLEDKTRLIQGAKVEHNKFSVTVHFRCVKEHVINAFDSLASCFASSLVVILSFDDRRHIAHATLHYYLYDSRHG